MLAARARVHVAGGSRRGLRVEPRAAPPGARMSPAPDRPSFPQRSNGPDAVTLEPVALPEGTGGPDLEQPTFMQRGPELGGGWARGFRTR
jgi:hypothetical protein